MMLGNADKIRKLLKGIETGDPDSVNVISPHKYIQHNPQTHEGRQGLAALFARLAKTSPRVNIVRAFEDGDFVFGHTEYDFASRRIGFEVFRFEDGLAVEHWDNIQPRLGPNSSGHSMVDGPVEAENLGQTEENRSFVRAFVEEVLVGRRLEKLGDYVAGEGYIEHNPEMEDGLPALQAALEHLFASDDTYRYEIVHRVLTCGNFVLCVAEGYRQGKHSAFYDLFRIANGKIAEHWDTVESVAPPEEWKNENGKF